MLMVPFTVSTFPSQLSPSPLAQKPESLSRSIVPAFRWGLFWGPGGADSFCQENALVLSSSETAHLGVVSTEPRVLV